MIYRLLCKIAAERINEKGRCASIHAGEEIDCISSRTGAPRPCHLVARRPSPLLPHVFVGGCETYMRILVGVLFAPSLRVVARCQRCPSSHRALMYTQLNRCNYLNRRSPPGYSCLRIRNKSA